MELTDKSLRGTKCVHSTACEDCDFLRLLEVVTYILSQSVSLSACPPACLSVCLFVFVCVHLSLWHFYAKLSQFPEHHRAHLPSVVCASFIN